MEKKIHQKFLYGIAIIWIVVLLKSIWKYGTVVTAGEGNQLEQACVTMDNLLKEQNATDLSYTVTLVASSLSRTKEEQRAFLNDVANLVEEEAKFGEEQIFDQTSIAIKEEKRSNGTSLSWVINESHWRFSAQYLDMEEDYVVLTLECDGKDACRQASYYMTYFQMLVEEYDLTGIPCGKMTTYLPSELTFKERNVLSENILYLFQAKEVDGIRGSDLYTIYGYSFMIPFYITVSEQPMNLNLSFSLIEDTKQTKLQIGIPIL